MKRLSVRAKNLTKTDRKRVRRAVVWLAERLLGPKMAQNTEIYVKFIALDPNLAGLCGWQDDNIRPRHFVIEVNETMGLEEVMMTICHEMVHVKQYVKGELKERYRPRMRLLWHDEEVSVDDEDLPWEKEAIEMETLLYGELVLEEQKWAG